MVAVSFLRTFLYCNWSLRTAYGMLEPNDVLAIWVTYSHSAVAARLELNGFDIDEVSVRAIVEGGEIAHTPWSL